MDEKMKIGWVIFWLIFIALLFAGLFGGGFWWLSTTATSYSLEKYNCEEIRNSIVSGDCLIKKMVKFNILVSCFTPEEKFIYYALFCLKT